MVNRNRKKATPIIVVFSLDKFGSLELKLRITLVCLAEYLVELRNQPSLVLTNQQPGPTHQYHIPSSTAGHAHLRRKRKQSQQFCHRLTKNPQHSKLFPAPPSGAQLVKLMPVASQGPLLVPAPQAIRVSLFSAPFAPAPAVRKLRHKVQENTCKKSGRGQGKRGHETTIVPNGNLHRRQGKRDHETPILPDGNLHRRQRKRGHETTILPDGNFHRRSGDDKESVAMKPLLCPMAIYTDDKESVAMKPLLCPMAIYTDDRESVAMKPLYCPFAIYTEDKESVAMKPLLCWMAIYTDGKESVTMKPLLCLLAIYTDALQMTRTDCP
ncbi:hypothetical protein E1301_Tti019673 [Triplophysa tibetana]|uniref:Uncharacterized protein n=1 Tax=Triplophysa tibetana TaxID=1572043 RepID=A0A5A9PJT8_9TELE|nr:hypothetical protein E1301_Tti019673 [Triplophysa tibetana]